MKKTYFLALCLLSFWAATTDTQIALPHEHGDLVVNDIEYDYHEDLDIGYQLTEDEQNELRELDEIAEMFEAEGIKVTYADPSWFEVKLQELASWVGAIPGALELYIRFKNIWHSLGNQDQAYAHSEDEL